MIFNVSGGGAVLPKGGTAGQVLTRTEDGTAWGNNYKYARNLLDNSDFTNPVNQRGITSFTGRGYTIDRWQAWDTTVTVGSGYIVTDNLFQYVVAPIDKVYTLAAGAEDGSIAVVATTPSVPATVTTDGVTVTLTNIGGYTEPIISSEKNLIWAALYEGEYTTETLPEYQPKGYSTELAECQRYYTKIGGAIAYGICTTNNTAEFVLPIPTTMRGNYPTYMFNNDLWAYRGDGSVVALTVTGAIATTGTVRFLCTTESSLNVSMCVPDVNCEISADL